MLLYFKTESFKKGKSDNLEFWDNIIIRAKDSRTLNGHFYLHSRLWRNHSRIKSSLTRSNTRPSFVTRGNREKGWKAVAKGCRGNERGRSFFLATSAGAERIHSRAEREFIISAGPFRPSKQWILPLSVLLFSNPDPSLHSSYRVGSFFPRRRRNPRGGEKEGPAVPPRRCHYPRYYRGHLHFCCTPPCAGAHRCRAQRCDEIRYGQPHSTCRAAGTSWPLCRSGPRDRSFEKYLWVHLSRSSSSIAFPGKILFPVELGIRLNFIFWYDKHLSLYVHKKNRRCNSFV